MISSSLYRLLTAHFESPRSPCLQIYQIYSIVTNSAFSAYVVHPHASEHDDKPIFIEDRWMIASCWSDFETFNPILFIKRVDLRLAEWKTAMPAHNHCHIFVYSGSVTLSWFRFPSLQTIAGADHGELNIFMYTLCRWFLNYFSNLSVEGG